MDSQKEYVRDYRSPTPKNDDVSRVMSSNRSKNTSPEVVLRRELRKSGITGYRLHWDVPGRPDLCFPGKKIAVFVNGCFWHKCPHCALSIPKTNTEFWGEKFNKNVERDARKKDALEEDGWLVVTIWECEIKKNLKQVVDDLILTLNNH